MSDGRSILEMVRNLLFTVGAVAGIMALLITIWREHVRWFWKLAVWLTLALAVAGSYGVWYWGAYQESKLRITDGSFEWQWAGERWYGTVGIGTDERSKERTATLKVNTITKSVDGDLVRYGLAATPVLQSPRDGRLYGDKKGFTLQAVTEQVVNGRRELVNLDAELHPVEAYAGIVRFGANREACEAGDIILVKTGLKLPEEFKAGEAPITLVRYTSGMRFH